MDVQWPSGANRWASELYALPLNGANPGPNQDRMKMPGRSVGMALIPYCGWTVDSLKPPLWNLLDFGCLSCVHYRTLCRKMPLPVKEGAVIQQRDVQTAQRRKALGCHYDNAL
jgi:hypothetical protein